MTRSHTSASRRSTFTKRPDGKETLPVSTPDSVTIRRRIALLARRGEGHWAFALHAAFPLSLTPRLAYLLWANFQTYVSNGAQHRIPWVAVSDLLLSPVCREIQPELYELDPAVRKELLFELEADERFGKKRIEELSRFLLSYVKKELTGEDQHTKHQAQLQRWMALAYVKPNQLAYELAERFRTLQAEEKMGTIRLAAITETFAEPLKEFRPLIGYAKYRAFHARGQNNEAKEIFTKYDLRPNELILGVGLPFYVLPDPPLPPSELPEKPIAPHTISIDRLQREGALTWLHLSDIHFGGPDPDGRPAVLNQLLKDIEERKAKDGISPDLIFITGDIAWSGKAEQYENMALPFLQELQFVTGVERDRIFLIPGNHDIDRSLVSNRSATLLAEDLLAEGSKKNEKAISTFLYGNDAEDRKYLLKKHSAYIEFVKKYFPHCAPLFDPCAYIAKVSVPDGLPFSKLWVLGLNSAWLSREGETKGNLLLGFPQVQKALGFIEAENSTEDDFVFALTHHPLSWMADWDEHFCKQQLAQRTDFHLSGHLHENAFSLNVFGPQRYSSITAGSANGNGGMFWYNGYYLARLDFTAGEAQAYIRSFSLPSFSFVPETSFNSPIPGEYRWTLPEKFKKDDRKQLLRILTNCNRAQLELLCVLLDFPNNLLVGPGASSVELALSILNWAEGPVGCGINQLKSLINKEFPDAWRNLGKNPIPESLHGSSDFSNDHFTRQEAFIYLLEFNEQAFQQISDSVNFPYEFRFGVSQVQIKQVSLLLGWADSPAGCGLRRLTDEIKKQSQKFAYQTRELSNFFLKEDLTKFSLSSFLPGELEFEEEVLDLLFRFTPASLTFIIEMICIPYAQRPLDRFQHQDIVKGVLKWVTEPEGSGIERLSAEISRYLHYFHQESEKITDPFSSKSLPKNTQVKETQIISFLVRRSFSELESIIKTVRMPIFEQLHSGAPPAEIASNLFQWSISPSGCGLEKLILGILHNIPYTSPELTIPLLSSQSELSIPRPKVNREGLLTLLFDLSYPQIIILMDFIGMPKRARRGPSASSAELVADLVRWAERDSGCGLEKLEEALNNFISFELEEKFPIHGPNESVALKEIYLSRREDDLLANELAKQHNLILIKSLRNSGRTALLHRALQQVRNRGERYCLIDLRFFTSDQLTSLDTVLLTIAQTIDEQHDLPYKESWRPGFPTTLNLSYYLKQRVLKPEGAFVLAFNEIDVLLFRPFASEFFSYIRSLHEAESNDSRGPWRKLTFVLTHTLPITRLYTGDLNRSPFNIGTQLVLGDFTLDQVRELNKGYGSLLTDAEVVDFYQLLGGEVGLIQIGFKAMISNKLSYTMFSQDASRDGGIFNDHLQHLLFTCQRNAGTNSAVRSLLEGQKVNDTDSFYKLRLAGIVNGETSTEMSFRSRLYKQYLRRHLL